MDYIFPRFENYCDYCFHYLHYFLLWGYHCCYYYLKEELRDELYPCVETEHGSFIYSDYIYNAISILDEIKDSVNLARVSLDSFNEGKESIGFLSGSSILLKGGKDE